MLKGSAETSLVFILFSQSDQMLKRTMRRQLEAKGEDREANKVDLKEKGGRKSLVDRLGKLKEKLTEYLRELRQFTSRRCCWCLAQSF